MSDVYEVSEIKEQEISETEVAYFREFSYQYLYELSQVKAGETYRDCLVIQNSYSLRRGDMTGADIVDDGAVRQTLAFSFKGNIFSTQISVPFGKTAWQVQVEQNIPWPTEIYFAKFPDVEQAGTLILPSLTVG